MKTYNAEALEFDAVRAHPWNVTGYEAGGGYVDFKTQGGLIEQTLEDFQPYASEPGVLAFYELVRDLNGPQGALETNDCALRPPGPHRDSNSNKPVVVLARLCVLYRQTHFNLAPNATRWLMEAFGQGLEEIDTELSANEGVTGFTLQPTAYVDLPGETEILQGQLLMLTFWAYGDTQAQAFDTLGRMANNVNQVAAAISDHVNGNFNQPGILEEIELIRSEITLPESSELKKL